MDAVHIETKVNKMLPDINSIDIVTKAFYM